MAECTGYVVIHVIYSCLYLSSTRAVSSSKAGLSEEKINPGLGSSIMVSVSKNGHLQKQCTTEMGVCFIQLWHNYALLAGTT